MAERLAPERESTTLAKGAEAKRSAMALEMDNRRVEEIRRHGSDRCGATSFDRRTIRSDSIDGRNCSCRDLTSACSLAMADADVCAEDGASIDGSISATG